ncbi:MAG: hypothetical protein C0596_11600 [Marinilabiliales bacterium]|nr:MAG: hypothetical protein C0596_11600 [Marinilabiliales bacterium]
MKKNRIVKILLLAFVLFISTNTFAWKLRTDTLVYAGAWGGASYSRIMGYTSTTSPLIGNAFGVKFWLQPKREFSFNTGIGFIQKGFISDIEYFDIYASSVGYYPTNYTFNYINIPIGLNYNLGQNKFNVYLSAGIDIDILLKQETFSPTLPVESNGVEVVNINAENTDMYKKLNFGVYIGGGIEYRIKPNFTAFADIKYMHGTNNILDVNSIYNLKQRPVIFGIGIRVGIPVTIGYYD